MTKIQQEPQSRSSPSTTTVEVRTILTRASGYLRSVCSHSLQPYRGCTFGGSLCGVACYVQHSPWVTRGRRWGSFLEVRVNAAEAYLREHAREIAWARRTRGAFSIFLSSATDPFLPQEARHGITRSVLTAMCDLPPDELILQTHGDGVLRVVDMCQRLAARCALRIHVSIESDRDRLPGLPPPACSVEARFAAVAALRAAGLRTIVTVSPLLPIADPVSFFEQVAACADGVVIDHFIGGDGSVSGDGARTLRTALPGAMAAVDAGSTALEYRDRMVAIARRILPGRVGVSVDGFAGRFAADGESAHS